MLLRNIRNNIRPVLLPVLYLFLAAAAAAAAQPPDGEGVPERPPTRGSALNGGTNASVELWVVG